MRSGQGADTQGAPARPRVERLLLADLPDDTGARNLDERRIGSVRELRLGIGPAEIPYRAEVDQVEGAVRPEFAVCRSIDPLNLIRKGLLGGLHAPLAAIGMPVTWSDALQLKAKRLGEILPSRKKWTI
jgi:hypothetical protein